VSSSPTTFRIRNKFHEVEGTVTAKDILKRIESGRYKGDEEISPPPFLEWFKLSSHPLFYDAFLTKLFHEKYHSPDQANPSVESPSKARAESSHSDRATRQAEPGREDPDSEVPPEGEAANAGRTRRLEGGDKEIGATIHQSAIDALFNDGSDVKPKTSTERLGASTIAGKRAAGTNLIKIDLPMDHSSPDPVSKLNRPLDIASQVAEEESPEFVQRKRKQEFRRKVIYGSALAILLCLLFQLGQQKSSSSTSPVAEAAVLQPATRELLDSSLTKEEKLEALIGEADALYHADDRLSFLGALDSYRSALTYNESDPKLLGMIAETMAQLLSYGENSDSLLKELTAQIKKGRTQDPTGSHFYRAESLVALSQQKISEAKRLIQEADEADPEDPYTYLIRGEIAYLEKDLGNARKILEEVVKAAPDSVRAHYLLARIDLDERNLPDAKVRAMEALKLNPFHPPTYLILGELAESQGDWANARSFFETSGRLVSFGSRMGASDAYFHLATLIQISGNKEGAQKDYLLAYYFDPSSKSKLTEGIAGGDTSAKHLKALAKEAAYPKSYFLSQAGGFLRDGNLEQAVQFYRAAFLSAREDGPTAAEALVKLGEVLEKRASSYADFRQVMVLYQRAIERNPAEAMAYIHLGLLESEQFNLDRGYKLLAQAAALAPELAEPYVALGKHFYKRQDYNEALTQFLKAAEIDSTNSEIFYYAGLLRLLGKKDGVRTAMASFQKAYVLDAQNYDALMQWLKLKTLNYEKNFAIKLVRNLIESDPRNPKLYWVLGEVYATDKEYRRAISYYHASLDLDNKSSKVRMSLGEALQAIGALDNAVEEYRLAAQLDRRNSEGLYKAADLLFQMKKFKEAENVLNDLIQLTPNYPGAHRYLSKVYQINRQRDQAIEAMKKEVANNPQNAKFKLELAELLMFYEKWEDAVTTITDVTNLPSLKNAPEYLYDKIRGYLLLSRCYRMLTRPESALAAVSLALDLDPEDPELHRERGYDYYALQRDQEGVKDFQYYLSRTPAAQDAETVRGLIQQMQINDD